MTDIIDFNRAKIANLQKLRDVSRAKLAASTAKLARSKASMHRLLLDIRLDVYDRVSPGQRATLEARLGAIHLAIAADVDTIPLSEHLLDGIDIGDGQAER
jgi:hypothetical protein